MLDAHNTHSPLVDIKIRQAPLREAYKHTPSDAMICDHATTRCDKIPASQPLHTEIEFSDYNQTRLPIALHKGVGGNSDCLIPGELFSGAIASCLDSTIRVISNMMGVTLETLEVAVECKVDLRGTLRMSKYVPTAFQAIDVTVKMVPEGDVPQAQLDAILAAAEQCCVVMQTLKHPPEITVQ